jgi:acyl dehydratase
LVVRNDPSISIAELRSRRGEEIGCSRWLEIPQTAVDDFARATGDDHWIHVDVERATAEFGAPLVHGFLTLALAGGLLSEVFVVAEATHELNYGLDRVRFPAPLLVNERVRMRVRLNEFEESEDAVTLTLGLTFETEGGDKPVCVASWIVREVLDAGAAGN